MEDQILDAVDSARASTGVPDISQPHSAPIQHEHSTTAMSIDSNEPENPMPDTAMAEPEDPPLTHALEALLGGLGPVKPKAEELKKEVTVGSQQAIAAPPEAVNAPMPTMTPGLTMHTETSNTEVNHTAISRTEANLTEKPTPIKDESASEPAPTVDGEGAEGEHPEWEVDSSPIESSSDDSSDDSSEDESEDGDTAYKLLSPEEQARILMGEEGDGSDDEGGSKAKGVGGPLRTKNEVPEVIIPKPDVTITANMPITELGSVETVVDNILLIKAKTSGEYQVLESGSVLCLEDRSVIGVVAETLGRVQQPLYSVMFTNATELKAAGLSVGIKVFYSIQHSTYVFTQALKAYKGSDASNLHDEEVGDEEIEFSDDEAEAEHKRKVKQKKLEKRGGKAQQNGGPRRGGHPLQQQHQAYNPAQGINYDDDEDGPYKPLARPSGYADSIGRSEAPQEGAYNNHDRSGPTSDNFRGRGRGDRGRGDRGRGRGDRGRGRGGYQDRRSDGYSLPPQPPQNFVPPPPPGMGFPPFAQSPAAPPNFFAPPQYSPNQPQIGWPQYPPQAPYQQPYQNRQNWPSMPNMPPAQNGAFLNPAFFQNGQASIPTQWNQQNQQQNERGRGK
ncbi:NAF1-domain-containing protein [Acephala macrosclerotiorum]|nr:NAF1-domain-containing protein [Acephala macrosclerotiorum]